MKRILKIVFLVWLAVTVLGAPFYWPYLSAFITYNPIIFAPKYPEPETATESRLQDLDYLRKLTSYDRSFNEEEKALFVAAIDQLETRAPTMSEVELFLEASKAVAIANNGHTNVNPWPWYDTFNKAGINLAWFADGLFVVGAVEDHAHVVGHRVTAVEGKTVDAIIESLKQYTGGNAQWRKNVMPMKIRSPEIMHAAGLSASPTEITLTLETASGDEEEYTFKARASGHGDDNWVHAFDEQSEATPLYLQSQENPLFSKLPNNGFYIRTKSGYEAQDLPTKVFLESSLAEIEDGELDYLVVDFRLNGGGNYMKSIDFVKEAPKKVKESGNIYLVVGPRTFSAAIVSTAMLKFYGGKRSVIVGEPMGDDEQFWAETGMPFKLPNSGIQVFYATGYHDWANGCGDHEYCFTLNRIHGVAAGSLQPTVLLERSFADYASGQDGVMNWIQKKQR